MTACRHLSRVVVDNIVIGLIGNQSFRWFVELSSGGDDRWGSQSSEYYSKWHFSKV